MPSSLHEPAVRETSLKKKKKSILAFQIEPVSNKLIIMVMIKGL